MTEIATRADMGAFDAADQHLARYLGLNPQSPQDRAAVAVCRHYGRMMMPIAGSILPS